MALDRFLGCVYHQWLRNFPKNIMHVQYGDICYDVSIDSVDLQSD